LKKVPINILKLTMAAIRHSYCNNIAKKYWYQKQVIFQPKLTLCPTLNFISDFPHLIYQFTFRVFKRPINSFLKEGPGQKVRGSTWLRDVVEFWLVYPDGFG